ncbi:MAG: glycosyltransferase family 2 protein [Bacilli bacterium]|nr:glycosyltransferase family 2 protein [Bacilli bacterium]
MNFITYLFNEIITFFGHLYPGIRDINNIIGIVFSALVYYKVVYFLVGMFTTRKFKKSTKNYKYGIVIAARNEEMVIGNLIDSIKKQDYPSDLITIFVVADNCTDKTASIVREKGCICYERFDDLHRTKGYALEYLFDNIDKDYGIKSFDGYFVFDADNLLKTDYISRMNDAFAEGEKIITSYRHSKNFDENWISSTYAIHWLRSIRTGHRARSVFHLATNIQGTGFLIASEIVENGWHYTSLTEDRALTVDSVASGYSITYQDEAIFYDEQPTNLKIALRQRLRWSKGHLLAFIETSPKLVRNIIFGRKYAKNKKSYESLKLNIIDSIRYRFASFDILMLSIPFSVINLVRWILVSVLLYSSYTYLNGIIDFNFFHGSTYLSRFLRMFFDIKLSIPAGIKALYMGLILAIWSRIFYRIASYFEHIFEAIYVFIIERKRIKKMSFWKKVLYSFTWPIFDIIGRYTTYVAVFKRVEWKPIPHNSKITIDDITKS